MLVLITASLMHLLIRAALPLVLFLICIYPKHNIEAQRQQDIFTELLLPFQPVLQLDWLWQSWSQILSKIKYVSIQALEPVLKRSYFCYSKINSQKPALNGPDGSFFRWLQRVSKQTQWPLVSHSCPLPLPLSHPLDNQQAWLENSCWYFGTINYFCCQKPSQDFVPSKTT